MKSRRIQEQVRSRGVNGGGNHRMPVEEDEEDQKISLFVTAKVPPRHAFAFRHSEENSTNGNKQKQQYKYKYWELFQKRINIYIHRKKILFIMGIAIFIGSIIFIMNGIFTAPNHSSSSASSSSSVKFEFPTHVSVSQNSQHHHINILPLPPDSSFKNHNGTTERLSVQNSIHYDSKSQSQLAVAAVSRQKKLQISYTAIAPKEKQKIPPSKEPSLSVEDKHVQQINQKPSESAPEPKTSQLHQELSSSHHDQNHTHVIPNNLIFTHYINLLNIEELDSSTNSQQLSQEDYVLAQNVQNTISLHPSSKVRFLTDDDCLQSISNVLSEPKAQTLKMYFQNESKGMYKADLCRGAALYETGGLYFDVDIQARMNIWSVLSPSTEFVTIKVHKDSFHPMGFFQAFVGVTSHHPVMKLYVQYFLEYYEQERTLDGPLGVILLREAYNDYFYHHKHPKDSQETKKDEDKEAKNYENDKSNTQKVDHNDSEEEEEEENEEEEFEGEPREVELWQEVRYHPSLFPNVVPPVGERRACHFMVAIPWKRHVAPFYSRVRGSRMCGGKDSHKQK